MLEWIGMDRYTTGLERIQAGGYNRGAGYQLQHVWTRYNQGWNSQHALDWFSWSYIYTFLPVCRTQTRSWQGLCSLQNRRVFHVGDAPTGKIGLRRSGSWSHRWNMSRKCVQEMKLHIHKDTASRGFIVVVIVCNKLVCLSNQTTKQSGSVTNLALGKMECRRVCLKMV